MTPNQVTITPRVFQALVAISSPRHLAPVMRLTISTTQHPVTPPICGRSVVGAGIISLPRWVWLYGLTTFRRIAACLDQRFVPVPAFPPPPLQTAALWAA